MKLLLVNDLGQTMARLDDVEKYDGTLPGHITGMLDMVEMLIASARKMNEPSSKPVMHMAGEPICESLST